MRYLLYAVVFFESLALSYALIPLLIRFARRHGVVDQPGHRKVHHVSKPLLGGVSIFGGFFVVVLFNIIGFLLLRQTDWVQTHLSSMLRVMPDLLRTLPRLIVILAGGFLIHLLGLIDDLFKEKLTYKPKFIAQFVIVTLVVLSGVQTQFVPGHIGDIVLTVIWIVGITNSFNLLDNLDGLTAGVSVIAGLVFFGVAVLQGQIFFAFILMALTGASLGFLRFNFHPSQLFMGDSGSLFLGYMFGTLTVMGSYVLEPTGSRLPVVMPLLILSIPLYDTFSVMFIRWREGRPLFEGDKRHFSHRLLNLGMSHRGTVIFIYLVCFAVALPATLLPYLSPAGGWILLLQSVVIYLLITILIAVGKRLS
jgi:UDP-GlcNAc:undecaprenyl-phosphate GlcNAc-1-phosphate transferase